MINGHTCTCSSESSTGQQSNQKEISATNREKQQLMAEVDEKKRRMLRDVEVYPLLYQYMQVLYNNLIDITAEGY